VTGRPKFEQIAKSDTTFARISEDNDYVEDEIVFVPDAAAESLALRFEGISRKFGE
jgi:hypothetical protein